MALYYVASKNGLLNFLKEIQNCGDMVDGVDVSF
jgi:hypothetical protein